MKYAVIKTGGKQYKVAEKQTLAVEKLKGEAGESVEFDQVLMIADGKGQDVQLGTPVLEGKKVAAKIVEQGRAKKINVVKYKPKIRYKIKKGHRQLFTKVQIDKIG